MPTAEPVAAIFDAYPSKVRARLIEIRKLILETAAGIEDVGPLEETVKWGQPSYLTSTSKSGSTIRIDSVRNTEDRVALYFNCQTNLVETFRALYGDRLSFEGNRAIVLDAKDKQPTEALRHCIGLALTYHRNKRAVKRR